MQKKVVIETLVGTGRYGIARACRLFGLDRSAVYRKPGVEGLVAETSRQHPCLGYRKVTALLRSVHGETINPKRVARLRRRDGLLASRGGGKRRRFHETVLFEVMAR